jgi:hypothetical protein
MRKLLIPLFLVALAAPPAAADAPPDAAALLDAPDPGVAPALTVDAPPPVAAQPAVGSASLTAARSDAEPPAPIVPTPESDPSGFLRALYVAVTSGAWKVVGGLLLLGLTYGTRRWVVGSVAWFKTRLGGFVLAFALSLATTFGLALAVNASVTATLVLNAVSTAAAAAGLWQWLQTKLAAPKAA